MNHKFSQSIKILLVLIIAVILFHICIILKIIPYDITWGGRLQNDNEMYVFESVSILLNLLLGAILLMKGDLIKYKFSSKILNVILWVFFAVFLLNTFGNLFSKTYFEKSCSILTGISAYLLWKIVNQQNVTNN